VEGAGKQAYNRFTGAAAPAAVTTPIHNAIVDSLAS